MLYSASTAASGPPNIVVIMIDDLGFGDLAVDGSRFHETPYIDSFAKQGIRFTQAYSAGPVCSPTRASLMTGKYPPRTGITNFLPGSDEDGRPLRSPKLPDRLAATERTFGEILRDAGYETGYYGKWHLGGSPD